jgi:endonuclease/exonuclease/phosphatase family metal-dependent hydrolase
VTPDAIRRRSLALSLTLAGALAHATPPAPSSPSPPSPAPSAPAATPVAAPVAPAGSVTLRVATFNLEDVRTDDLKRRDQPRVQRLAEVIQRLRPNIILLNEIAYDMPGAPDVDEGESPGQNAQRFIDNYLSIPQVPGLRPIRYRAFMAPSNTGIPSGFDLDNDGNVVTEYPDPPRAGVDGSAGRQTPGGRAFGNDCWGFGTFPGQYAMALLVDERLVIDADNIRTFRLLPWDYVAGAFMPKAPDGTPWFTDDERALMRLSSKSHWDVPVRLPNGAVLHLLCSHPTPPAFDGPEERNKRRNHDEIRFWRDYIDNAPYVVDDDGRPGGLPPRRPFVILGDLNADPDEGNAFRDPIDTHLATSRRINMDAVPRSPIAIPRLDDDDTARFGLRVDYALASRDLVVLNTGVWRDPPTAGGPADTNPPEPAPPAGAEGESTRRPPWNFPSDHFPVWIEVAVPQPEQPLRPGPAR